jgi:hypothetical protein
MFDRTSNAQPRPIYGLPTGHRGHFELLAGAPALPSPVAALNNPALDALPPEGPGPAVVWAGWLDERGAPAQGVFPPDHRLWTRAGWDALRAGLERWRRASQAPVLLRPAAGCVLGDPQSCLTFVREGPPAGVGLLLDPVSMLTPAMLNDLPEHLERCCSALAGRVEVWGVVLAGPVVAGERVRHGPLRSGGAMAQQVLEAWRGSELGGLPVVVADPGDVEPVLAAQG